MRRKAMAPKNVRTFLLFLNIVCYSALLAQELPPVVKYAAADYRAGNQNWMISQDDRQFMYVANNEGLLEFNGADWTLYPSQNETIIRSVKVIGARIYTGSYMEFGFYTRSANGTLQYKSLSAKIRRQIVDDEQFWNIVSFDQWVVFQSLSRIYIYDTKSDHFKIIAPPSGILKAFKTNSAIYYQTLRDGVFEIENGKSRPVISQAVLGNIRIVNIFEHGGHLLLQTQSDGFFYFIGGRLVKHPTDADALLSATTIYNSLLLSDGSFALGSISNGIFILSPSGKLRYHITQSLGLGNNTILSLFEDKDHNLWMGLDNGINCINIASPIRSFTDNTGILGTVYASIVHNGTLYVGTNQGLFSKPNNTAQPLRFIEHTKGQVWSLFNYEGTLFCGHDSGTFIISAEKAESIYRGSGTWKFEVGPNNPLQILQGNYSGLSILEKSATGWTYKTDIPGFNYSSKYFEILGNSIYVSHEYKGVYRLDMAPGLAAVKSFHRYNSPAKGKNASLVKHNNRILYASKEGIFALDVKKDRFNRDKFLSAIFSGDAYTSGKMITDDRGNLWIFTKNSINFFSLGKLSSSLKLNTVPIPSSLTNSMLGYENIAPVGNGTYLVGTTDGYCLLKIDSLPQSDDRISITSATQNYFNQPAQHYPIAGGIDIKYAKNNINFNFAVPEYHKYSVAEYQHRLVGADEQWTNWSLKSSAAFKNLSPGNYQFQVRVRIANTLTNVAVFEFAVLRPWYTSIIAVLCYALLLGIIAYFVHKSYKSYYQKQKDKLISENQRHLAIKELENEQQLMKVRNQQLVMDVESKNRELAVSTMSLIKKNELLSLIKDDLNKTEDSSRNIKTVISTINKNISEEDTWNLFKDAFNNADKDFLKKIKQLHPALTPNDLRLCAYLRLNLSSKEIAPLLNISVRSVEIKRYRLRKKMDLPHEQGLVEYILSI